MISKNKFDLLLQEISQIENKIIELKVLNKFDKANEYECSLEAIKAKATNIVLEDNENQTENFDELSLEVLSELILLSSNIDYYFLKINNIIESATDNKIDEKALAKVKKLWIALEEYKKAWNESTHNPIEEIEYNKQIGKMTLEIIIYQLQIEAIIDLPKIFNHCKKEFLVTAIKELLFEGARDEIRDEIRRRRLIELAKNISEVDLYDYKLWQQVLMIKEVRSRDDHIEIIGNINEKDNRKYVIEDKKQLSKNNINLEDNQELELFYDESIFNIIKKWISNFNENSKQRKMEFTWTTTKGPAFKIEFCDDTIKYSKEYLDKKTIENIKKLTIASKGVAKYNFEKDYNWDNLEALEFLEKKDTSSVNLSPDKTYNCIGNDTFSNCKKLKDIKFGKIEMIGERAFKNCTNLSTITFSESLMNIGDDAFIGCKNLKKVIFQGELSLYILERPQNIINCFRNTNLEEIVFYNLKNAFNFAIVDCPHLKNIYVSNISGIQIPFKICKYRLGRQEGIVSFIGEKSLNLWKKRNSNIRFFELTDEDKRKYNLD